MADIFDLAQSINRRRKQASQGYASGWEDLPMQVMKMMDTREKEKRVDNINMAETLGETFKHIKTPEGLSKWKSSLNQLKVDGANDSQIKLMTDMYDTAADEWNTNYTNFTNAVDMGSEFVNSEGFSDEEDEWLNLSELAKKNEYDSTVDFISFEKERVMNMMDDLKVGVDGGMTYGGKDKEVIRKLGKYAQSLDLATQTLLGDGIITPEEAQHIAIGDTKLYQADKERALGEAVTMIKKGMNDTDSYDKFLDWVNKKEITSLTQSDSLNNFGINLDDHTSSLSDGTTVINYDTLRTKILDKKELNESSIVRYNNKYKNWAGRLFAEGEFGVETEDDFIIDKSVEENLVEPGVSEEEADEERDERLKAFELKEKKKEERFQKKKEDVLYGKTSIGGADIEIYEAFNPMAKADNKKILDSLGEKSIADVKKKYVPAGGKGLMFSGKYKTGQFADMFRPPRGIPMTYFTPTNLKWEDAKKNLESVLDDNNLDINKASSYVAQNIGKDFEKRFQKFLDDKSIDANARNILYYISPNLYKIKKGMIENIARLDPKNPAGAEGQFIRHNKDTNPKQTADYMERWSDIDGYESLMLLYNFVGEDMNKGNK